MTEAPKDDAGKASRADAKAGQSPPLPDEAAPRLSRRDFALRLIGVAVIGVALALLIATLAPRRLPARSAARPVAVDVNGDGKVDVRDAWLLARRIKSGEASGDKWDLNGDGIVNAKDADAVALAAAKLPPAAAPAAPMRQPLREEDVRFYRASIFLNTTSTPLAAYEVAFQLTSPDALITGLDGGDTPAFHVAPAYDPDALEGRRIVLAGYQVSGELPHGRTCVAHLVLRVWSGGRPTFIAGLVVASGPDGNPIEAAVSAELEEAK